MSLRKRIDDDLKRAVKQGKRLKMGTLRMLVAALVNKEKEKRYEVTTEDKGITEQELSQKSELLEEEVSDIINSEAKKRREATEAFEKGGRQDLVEKEQAELEVLQAYLPEQLREDELLQLVKDAVESTGASNTQDMGKVMAELMPKVKGRADGALVSKTVKEMLST
ncbi:GatB/YqeY domain-containing protein [Patescibacteria group bacterium]|nr:GatB/YqeY domain-containing protein [Patescibacteria group bacterium]